MQTHFVAAGRREARAYNLAVSASYVTVGLPYAKKPARLKDLLVEEKARPKRRQAWPEQKALIMLALGVKPPEEK